MNTDDLSARTREALRQARSADNGRHAEVLVHDGPLRQSLIALRAGTVLAEHNSPPAASLYLVVGSVRVTGTHTEDWTEGEVKPLTHARHSVEAVEDSVFVLTTVTGVPGQDSFAAPAH